MRFTWRRARQPAATEAERAVAWGDQLVKVHRWLLDELNDARRQLVEAGAAAQPSPLLVAHCMSFCDALNAHHEGEDGGTFPHLEAEHDELRPALERLRREHVDIAEVVREVRDLLAGGDSDADNVVRQLDELTQRLSAHFAFEEEQLVAILNRLTRLPWDPTMS